MKKMLRGLVGAGAALLFVSFNAQASVCGLSDVTAAGVDATDCGLVAGNDKVGKTFEYWDVNLKSAGGDSEWVDFHKSDGDESMDLGLMVEGSESSGDWSVDTVFSEFLVVLKAGPNYVWYLFDRGDGAFEGTWDTVSLSDKDLSHLTLYIKEDGSVPPAIIPVPAAAWLFASALLGLIGIGRRRSKV